VPLEITLYTDPACPFAFSAEPVRWRLRWFYGDGLRWTPRMIVLTHEKGEAEKLAAGAPTLQRMYGMPIDPRPYPRPASSELACAAVVAARLTRPDRAEALLRALRVRVMQRGLLDDPRLIAAAAEDAGLDYNALAQVDVEAALEEDIRAARNPSRAARSLDHKLGGPREERRYTAPSYELRREEGDEPVVVPGFNPVEAYETAIANLDPELPRRPRPESPEELLAWAGEPLATAEVAMVMGIGREDARVALGRVARALPSGADAYWAL
jgi:2-hydroxychromene-2-carboxylate isomerase